MNLLMKNQLIANSLCNLLVKNNTILKTINRFNTSLLTDNYSTNNRVNENKYLLLNKFNSINETNCIEIKRNIKTSAQYMRAVEDYTAFDALDGIVYKIRRYLGFTSIPKYRLRNTSVYLYESCTDGIPIENYFKHLNLPNTFLSWFLVTQLHVWMCMARGMAEGKEGRVLRNELVARMWMDCETRLKKFSGMSGKARREGLEDLLQQFEAMIFSYDEGFLTDDKTLAAALWRTLYTFDKVEPKDLEVMVSYVRTQMDHLNTTATEKFFLDGKILWKPFPPLYP